MSDMSSAKASSPPKPVDPNALSFEDALAELERIVRGLEGGQQRLEDAITAYERGSALRQHCESKLREAEMRVERIVGAAAAGPAAGQGTGQGASRAQFGQETTASNRANASADLDEEIPF